MSLYEDLTEILTPYADKINQNTASLDDLRDDIVNGIESDLYDICDEVNVNLFSEFVVNGYYTISNSAVVTRSGNGYVRSLDKISIDPAKKYVVSFQNYGSYDYVKVGVRTTNGETSASTGTITDTKLNDDKYFVMSFNENARVAGITFSFFINDTVSTNAITLDEFMAMCPKLEEGEVPTVYTPPQFGIKSARDTIARDAIKKNTEDIAALRDDIANLDVETDKTLSIDGKPADAKSVGDAITNMRSAITHDITGEPLSDYEWVQGEIKNGTGTNGSSSYYIRINDYIHVYAGDIIHFDMATYPYKYVMFFYTDAAPATWTGEKTLLDNSVENYTIESECYIRLKLNPNPSRTVTEDDKTQMPSTITVVRAGSASAILNAMNTDIGIAKTEALAVSEDFEHVIDKMCETSALEWYKAYVKPDGSTGSTSKNLVTGFVYMRDYTFVGIETENYDIEFEVCFYDENKAFLSRESLLSKGVTSYHKQFKGKGYLRVVFSRLDRDVLTNDDITHIRNCITIKTLKNTDKYESMLIQMNRRWNGTGSSGGQYNSKNKILTLAHFSDIHADAKTFGDMVLWFNKYDKYLTDVVCTGDIVYNVYSTGYEFWTRLADTENIMYVLGNHEQNSGGGFDNALSESDAYDMYFDGKASVWGVTLPQGKTYWYKDYQDEKIRMIGINSNYAVPNFFDSTEGAAQYTWFVEALEGARTNGLSVLVLSHIRPYDSDGHVVDCNFSMIGRGGGTPTIVNEIHSAINDFVVAGGEFIGFLVGHTHGDDIWQCGTYPDQYAFCVTCATCYGYYSDQDRILDTESEMAFNVVSIDTSAKILKIMRIGADVDSYMRSRKYLTWDYRSHQIITSG